MDHFLVLAKLDSAGNILNHFKENVDSIDDSLILHFLKSVKFSNNNFKLLDIITEPFPQDFSMKIVNLVSKLQLEAIEASDSKPKLLEFFGIF